MIATRVNSEVNLTPSVAYAFNARHSFPVAGTSTWAAMHILASVFLRLGKLLWVPPVSMTQCRVFGTGLIPSALFGRPSAAPRSCQC